MNLFFMQAALADEKLVDASFDGNALFLMTAYPGYPIKEMMELGVAAVDVVLLANEGKATLDRLLDPLNTARLDFAQRSVIAETLLWASAYLRAGTPLESAYKHWEHHYRGPAGRRDVERYRAVNEVLFEYAYRTINQFPGGGNWTIPSTGFIRSYLENNPAKKSGEELYHGLNLECGFKSNSKEWNRDPIFMSIFKTVQS